VFLELHGDCFDCGGTRECKVCFGTGNNPALNSDEPKCLNCDGTGVCPACRRQDDPMEIITLGL
jgi:hypothetical protein